MVSVAPHALIPAPLIGRESLKSSHIHFSSGHKAGGTPVKTIFQSDFGAVAELPKRHQVQMPKPAEVEHKDLRHIREYLTETRSSFTPHSLEPLSHTLAQSKLTTNFKMHGDGKHVTFLTMASEGFPHHAPAPIADRAQLVNNARKSHVIYGEKLPVLPTTQQSSYPGHDVTHHPTVKAPAKHFGGAPTIQGEKDREFSYITHHKDVFQGKWSSPALPMEKNGPSSLPMGDEQKIHETLTTYVSSFHKKEIPRFEAPKGILKMNLGDYRGDSLSTTTSDSYCLIKPSVVSRVQINRNISSVPMGDTQPERNRESVSVTSNRLDFPQQGSREVPAHVVGPGQRTRSNVEIGKPRMGGLFYSTTARDAYQAHTSARARPDKHPPSHLFPSGSNQDTGMTTMQRDYQPPQLGRQVLNPSRLHEISACHITAPCRQQYFTTTQKEAFCPKSAPRLAVHHGRDQSSHMPF